MAVPADVHLRPLVRSGCPDAGVAGGCGDFALAVMVGVGLGLADLFVPDWSAPGWPAGAG
jgi:hypothetical protein